MSEWDEILAGMRAAVEREEVLKSLRGILEEAKGWTRMHGISQDAIAWMRDAAQAPLLPPERAETLLRAADICAAHQALVIARMVEIQNPPAPGAKP